MQPVSDSLASISMPPTWPSFCPCECLAHIYVLIGHNNAGGIRDAAGKQQRTAAARSHSTAPKRKRQLCDFTLLAACTWELRQRWLPAKVDQVPTQFICRSLPGACTIYSHAISCQESLQMIIVRLHTRVAGRNATSGWPPDCCQHSNKTCCNAGHASRQAHRVLAPENLHRNSPADASAR